MTMTERAVLGVLAALDSAGIRVWLDGGWGVDALLGVQTRAHDDLDLVVDSAELPRVFAVLTSLGFRMDVDWLPTRAAFGAPDGRRVDLHPVSFDGDGTGWQARAGADGTDAPYPKSEFVTGRVGDRVVGCTSARLQVAHHCGYEPGERDRADMTRLAEVYTIALPDPYNTS